MPPGSPRHNNVVRRQQYREEDVEIELEIEDSGGRGNQNGDEDEELPDWEPDANQFDHLEQEDEDDLHAWIRELDLQDLINSEEDGYDEDFGLPNGDDDPPAREIPQFQMPMEHAPEPEPEEDPQDNIDIGKQCAAFQEHELIRNAYVNALVQKLLHGATHSALAHQLHSAK